MKIAHTRPETGELQSIASHAIATAELAQSFAVPPLKSVVYAMGLLHDIGKYQDSFQKKIREGKKLRVDHSTCGALEAKELFGQKSAMSSLVMQYCIAGHHAGLPNGGTQQDTKDEPSLFGRLKRKSRLEDYGEYKDELAIPSVDDAEVQRFLLQCPQCRTDYECFLEVFAFLVRYCFSCLTDADSLDTASFCSGRKEEELTSDLEACLQKIQEKMNSFCPETDLQKARAGLQEQVYEKVEDDAEIYLMNMPTGSGKTLCSMKFALMRAKRTGKKRIIYVIPYNSIIDQTVAVFEEVFGESVQILRHQSSYSVEEEEADEDYQLLIKNVTENWNAQVIVTTSVQFFESLYGNKRSKLRKMHHMADSILIFDEAHLMPPEYLKPCLRSVAFLTRLLHSEALFLTATMPDFEKLMARYALQDSRIRELVTDKSLFPCFRKARFVQRGLLSEEQLVEEAQQQPASLIVVNKRKTAAHLYEMASGKRYHLSTYMTAFDRKRVIDEVKAELSRLYADYPDGQNVPEDRRIFVVSTSLIEAGVDLDFFAVYRELSGLDSILQAGGRCNREGKRQEAAVYVFRLEEGVESDRVNLTRSLMEKYEDVSSPDCIREYYDRLYQGRHDQIRINSIARRGDKPWTLPFADYARNFQMISDDTVSVAVACDPESRELMERLRQTGKTNHRRLQKYTFTVYVYELNTLIRQGAVKEYGGIWCLEAEGQYRKDMGIQFDEQDIFI